MRASNKAFDVIKKYESFKPDAYLCPSNIPTCGWGHTRNVSLGMSTTKEQAEKWLQEDAHEVEATINKVVTSPLSQGQYDALVSFVFNVGPGVPGKKDGFVWLKKLGADGKPQHSTMLKMLNLGRYEAAAGQFQYWISGGGNVLGGLVKRRADETTLFRGGETA